MNPRQASKRFAATFLMPDTAERTTVSRLGITPDTWTWDLVLRIKHRFGIFTEAFFYQFKELNLITETSSKTYIQKRRIHYKQTGFGEPDASRRIFNTNGLFFELQLTADRNDPSGQEIKNIYTMVEELKPVIN